MVDPHDESDRDLETDIEAVNVSLSAWAARSATESETLISRFEAMGYEVRGKSEAEIAEALRHPPGRRPLDLRTNALSSDLKP